MENEKNVIILIVFVFLILLLSMPEKAFAQSIYPYNYVSQAVLKQDGTTGWNRTCPVDAAGGIIWNGCSLWKEVLTNSIGLGDLKLSSQDGFVFTANGKQILVQSLVNLSGDTTWTHYCPIDPQTGIAWSQCHNASGVVGQWDSVNNSTINLGNGLFSSVTGLVYTTGGQQKLIQAITSKDGLYNWSRECPINSQAIKDSDAILWNQCNPLNFGSPVLSNALGLGDIRLAYNGGFSYWNNGVLNILQTLVSQDGQTSWSHSCPIHVNEPWWKYCTGWTSVNSDSIGLGNIKISASTAFSYGTIQRLELWPASDIDKQVVTLMNIFLAANPIETSPGIGGKNIQEVYSNSTLNNEKKAHSILEITCGPDPSLVGTTLDLESMAHWRGCTYAVSYMFMAYSAWTNNRDLVNVWSYQAISETDSLATTSTDSPFHGLIGPQYRLGNTNYTKSYLNDGGMGVLGGFGWLRSQGFIDQAYCSTLETPYDPGKNCKTIDLYARIRDVATRVISTTDGFKSWQLRPVYLAWSSAGRAVAAVISGNTYLISQLIPEANSYIYTEFGTSSPFVIPVIWDKFGVPDRFQHLEVALHLNNWVVPEEYKYLYSVWSNTYFGSYFQSQYPIANIDQNTYIPQNIPQVIQGAKVAQCNSSIPGDWQTFYTSGTTTVGERGEYLSDALLTIGPALMSYLSQSGQRDSALRVAEITAQSANSAINHLPDWNVTACNLNTGFGGTTHNQLENSLRVFAYLYYTHMGFLKTPFGNFLANPLPIPIPGDITENNDTPGDHVNVFDYNLMVTNFNNPYTIFDYNDLVTNFGK